MKNDLISRKALLDQMESHIYWGDSAVGLLEVAKDAPAIDAEPVKHGWWINPRLNKYGHPCHQCSQCLFVASQKDRHFCPDCGAKMDGGREYD